jgi:heptosyltransferase-2
VKIHFLVKKQFRNLVEHNPNIDHVHAIESSISLRDFLKFRNQLFTDYQFDAVVDLHDSLRSRIMGMGAGLPVYRYSKDRFRRWLYIYWKIQTRAMSYDIVEKYFRALEDLGIQGEDKDLEFYFPEHFETDSVSAIDDYMDFAGSELPVTVAPGAAWKTKQWLPERFAMVCEHLISEYDATIALLGSAAEEGIARDIYLQLSGTESVFNYVGKTSIMESAMLTKAAKLHIANDSGLTHIARAVGTPAAVVMGGTTPELGFFQNFTSGEVIENSDLWCRPCSHIGRDSCPLGHFRCMKNISTEQVINTLQRMIN